MEENQSPHPDYLKGFNEGYIMNKYEPELTQDLSKALPVSVRANGFKDGVEQFTVEKTLGRMPAWLQKDRLSNLIPPTQETKDKDIEKNQEG